MKHYSTPICLFLVCVLLSSNDNLTDPRYKKKKYDGVREQFKQDALFRKDPNTGDVPTERLWKAKELKDRKLSVETQNGAVPGIAWNERGPNNVGGRTRAIWFDRNDFPAYRKVWAAGVGGGLWFTNDITQAIPVWNKVNDLFDNIAITCFVQNEQNPQIMYFGTGEGWFNQDAQRGLGIWRSLDGGNNWTRLSSTSGFSYVNDLAIDNNGNIFASIYADGLLSINIGIQRSSNNGDSWTRVLAPFSITDDNAGGDLEIASNGDIYASIGYANSGRVYKSPSGNPGTWTHITPNASGLIISEFNFFTDWGRIELATAPSNSNIVYALFKGINSSDCSSIQQYNASLNTWSVRSVPTIVDQGANSVFTRGQGWYNLIATVDPNNENTVYIGGIDALRSNNGGTNWQQISAWSLFNSPGFDSNQVVHADHHNIQFAPGSSSRAIWGTDGGVYYTTNANNNPAKPTFVSKNTGYNVTQYYHCAVHPTNTNYFLAGSQDNGTHQFISSGINSVNEVTGGDGGRTYIDQDNPSLQITSYVFNNYFVSSDGGNSFAEYNINDNGLFINASDYDDANNILYAADTFRTFLRWKNPGSGGSIERVNVPALNTNGLITTITVSPSINNRIYVGLLNGQVFAIDDAHIGFEKNNPIQLRPLLAIGTPVSSIAVDPSDENHIIITSAAYGSTKVYEAKDAVDFTGVYPSWINKEGSLPDIPINDCMFDPRNPNWAILATDLGIWTCDNLNAGIPDWQPTNNGMANTRVNHLEYRSSDKALIAATHGRGLFSTNIPSPTTPGAQFSKKLLFVEEKSTATLECRGFTDYIVNLEIGTTPTGTGTITFQWQNTSTSLNGIDYVLSTNGDFINPSQTLTFSPTSPLSQPITVRVFDDTEPETTENIILTYTVSGTINIVAGTGPQTCELRVFDNDRAVSGPINTNFTITTTTFNHEALPFSGEFSDGRSHMIFKRSYLIEKGMTNAGAITALAFNVTQKNSTSPYNNFTVKLKNVTSFSPVSTFQSGSSLVFAGNYTTSLGWNTISLNTPFLWDGISDLYVDICYDNNSGSANDLVESSFEIGIGGCGFRVQNSGSGCEFLSATNELLAGTVRPNIRFTVTEPATPIASVVNSSSTAYLGPLADVYFYTATGEIIARVKNLSTHNYGCTQIIVDRAGTGVTPFWNANPGTELMNKTLRVLPAINTANGNFEITLYYSAAEVAGWQNATNRLFSDIEMVRSSNPISVVTPSNPTAGGPTTLVNTIKTNLGSNRAISGSFSGTISSFGAGNPGGNPLPVALKFKSSSMNEKAYLTWTTFYELNNKGFVIQKSIDGLTFDSIAFIPGYGNSNIDRHYQYIDPILFNGHNYYRLKQLDLDGKFSFSKTELVDYSCTSCNWFRLLRNPARDNIEILFSERISEKTIANLFSPNGELLAKRVVETQQFTISTPNYPNGIYILEIVSPSKRESIKILLNK